MTITNELLKCELNYVLDDNNSPWFSGKGVGIVLGYTNPQKSLRDHVDDDDMEKLGTLHYNSREKYYEHYFDNDLVELWKTKATTSKARNPPRTAAAAELARGLAQTVLAETPPACSSLGVFSGDRKAPCREFGM